MLAEQGPPKATVEDYLRALAYFGLAVWAVAFAIFPPTAYVDSLDTITRLSWIGVGFLGAVTAGIGAVTRRDLKVELPGLIIMDIGPLFYFAANIYYVINPPDPANPTSRNALVVYAILPLLFSLPRIYSLYTESMRAKHIAMNAALSKRIRGGN